MGKYCVRFKGAKVKGAFKPFKSKTPDEEAAAAAEVAGTQKMKIGTPEKDVVAKVFGVTNKVPPKAKKKELVVDEKGSSKSGNYGHAGRVGKVGGSTPKPGAATGGGGLTGDWTSDKVDAALKTNARLMAGLNNVTNRDERIARRNDLEKQRSQLEDKKAELEKSGAVAAKPAAAQTTAVDHTRTDSWLKDFPDKAHLKSSMYAYDELKSVYGNAHSTVPGGSKVKVVIPGASSDVVMKQLSDFGFSTYGKSGKRNVMSRDRDNVAAVVHSGAKTGTTVELSPYEKE